MHNLLLILPVEPEADFGRAWDLEYSVKWEKCTQKGIFYCYF